ncbi:hypothetical protein AWC38_SpisGene19125 [Stylophora pistillata]|uniref:Uncharacterized protein n=1 Tax=Stylophora pistillata TaxID=50429 RepID=A0A2B4RG54_STYPI|nr:hypothetical protein AWC38_SpisGene19125 [Stylophora pistillata]
MLRCWKYQIAARPDFVNLGKTMDTYLKTKTYVDIVDMDKYDHDKYKCIDDPGAVLNLEDARPDERGAAATNPKREGGEHSSTVNPFVTEEDINSLPFSLVNRPDPSQFPSVFGEEDVDSLEYPPLIEAEGHTDSVFPLDVEEGITSKPETDADDQGVAAVQSVREAGEKEPNTCLLENTKDEQDDIENNTEDQGDAVDLCDEAVGVQGHNGYQLAALNTDEIGNDEDEEPSEATPLVQD